MRICDCGEPLDFESARCRACHRMVAFDPVTKDVKPLSAEKFPYLCTNSAKCGCNWLADNPGELCLSCGVTKVIPPQHTAELRAAWRRFERAKRRLVAGLLRLGLLPSHARTASGNPLQINLLVDRRSDPTVHDEFILTGHSDGTITINTSETDQVKLESTRLEFKEPYRTLLGSLRHESGHFFWSALIDGNAERMAAFRRAFGDERQDYQQALANYYEKSGKRRRRKEFISGYAQAHPHEDWAETWAHFLHIGDVLSTAAAAGMIFEPGESEPFETLLHRFLHVSRIANALNRSLGHRPAYPFSYTPEVTEKLRFVAGIVAEAGGGRDDSAIDYLQATSIHG